MEKSFSYHGNVDNIANLEGIDNNTKICYVALPEVYKYIAFIHYTKENEIWINTGYIEYKH